MGVESYRLAIGANSNEDIMGSLNVRLQPEGFYSIEITTGSGKKRIVALADTEQEARDKISWLKQSGHYFTIAKAAND